MSLDKTTSQSERVHAHRRGDLVTVFGDHEPLDLAVTDQGGRR